MRDGGPLREQAPPRSLTRAGRVALLLEVADALLNGRKPGREAALFLASAVLSWRDGSGSLEAHLRIGAPRGSHQTARAIAKAKAPI